MKLTDFSKQNRQWDRYKAFHANVDHGGHFVQFETGELMTTKGSWKPYQRRFYSELNLEVFSPRDTKYKLKTPDGRIVPNAWVIGECAPTLLLDHDSGRVVSIPYTTYGRNDKKTPRASHLEDAKVWFNNVKDLPQSDTAIRLSKPRKLDDDLHDWIADLKTVCEVYAKLNENVYPVWHWKGMPMHELDKHYDAGKTVHEVFALISNESKVSIARYGINKSRVIEEVPYLELVKE